MNGFAIAFSEITLVLFTTLAPAGAVGYALMMLPILRGRVDDAQHRRLDRLSCLPLGIAMAGLIASATHLGNPSNALYVFVGVGRSPLSTEVFCAVIFLMLAGVYWLYSFAEQPRRRLQRFMVAAIDGSIVAFLISMAFAYDVDTILTWSLPLVPVALLLNGLTAGPIVALAGLAAAGYQGRGSGGSHALIMIAAVALGANVIVYGVLGVQLGTLENELVSAAQLVPIYAPCLVGFAGLAAGGLGVAWRAERAGVVPVRSLVLANALILTGIFIMRFTFYMSHLTVGLGA